MRRAIFATLLLASSASFTNTSFAQATDFDLEAIRTSCKESADECAVLIADLLKQLKDAGLTIDQINTQVAILAAEVIDAASETQGSHNVGLASVLAVVAAASSDSSQSASIMGVARGMESGSAPAAGGFAIPVAASPA